MTKKTKLKEIVYCDYYDRIIYIERNLEGEWIGLNFMQGNDIKDFEGKFDKNDEKLLEFYFKFFNKVNHSDYLQTANDIISMFMDICIFFDIKY